MDTISGEAKVPFSFFRFRIGVTSERKEFAPQEQTLSFKRRPLLGRVSKSRKQESKKPQKIFSCSETAGNMVVYPYTLR